MRKIFYRDLVFLAALALRFDSYQVMLRLFYLPVLNNNEGEYLPLGNTKIKYLDNDANG